jgi:hypothetical protein
VSFVAGGIKSLVGVVKRHAIAGAFAAVALAGAAYTAPAYAVTFQDPSGLTVTPTYSGTVGTKVGSFDFFKDGSTAVDKDEAGVLSAIATYEPSWGTNFVLNTTMSVSNPGGNSLITAAGVLFAFFSGNDFHAFLFSQPRSSLLVNGETGLNHIFVFSAGPTAAVPVPAGALLLPAGLALLGLMKWRRKRPMDAATA